MLDIELHLDDDSGDGLRSLHRWLVDVPEFRGRVTTREQSPQAGEMGARSSALILALEGATERAADILGHTLASWAEAQRRTASTDRLILQARTPDGMLVAIDTGLRDGQLDPSLRVLVEEITTLLRRAGQSEPPTAGASPPTVDSTTRPAGFTDDELQTLAAAFDCRETAEALLRAAGMKPETFATFGAAPSALAWWKEISRVLALGKEPHGRHRLLGAAAIQFPANPTFTGPQGRNPAGESA
jgi:hypothetical protein